MLASWTSATALTATSGPTFAYFYGTSTSATSTLQGGFLAAIGGGNIGIGTSTPGALFSLAGQGAANQSLLFSGINMVYASSSTTTIPTGVNAFSIATSSSTAIPMLSFDTTNSRVGFGTTSPSATFSVAGTGYFGGSLGVGTTSAENALSLAGDIFIGSAAGAGTGGTLRVGGTNQAIITADPGLVAMGRKGCTQANRILVIGHGGCVAGTVANYDIQTGSADPMAIRVAPNISATANILAGHSLFIGATFNDDGNARTYTDIDVLNIQEPSKGTNTTVTTATGLYVNNPTIGGTNRAINTNGDIFKNGTAYTNPDYVFEKNYTGQIVIYKDKLGASTYPGLKPLSEVESFASQNYKLPLMAQNPEGGLFDRGDLLLASVEESYLYLFDHEKRLAALESASSTKLTLTDPTNAWSVDQSSGKVNVNFFGDLNLNGNSILNVSKILGMDGKWKIDETGNLAAETVTTKKLCLDDLCIDKEKLKIILESADITTTSTTP